MAGDDELDAWSLYDLPAEPITPEAIWTGAKQMIDLFPEEAEQAALERAEKALEQGDLSGFALWSRIAKAVAELMQGKPDSPREMN